MKMAWQWDTKKEAPPEKGRYRQELNVNTRTLYVQVASGTEVGVRRRTGPTNNKETKGICPGLEDMLSKRDRMRDTTYGIES